METDEEADACCKVVNEGVNEVGCFLGKTWTLFILDQCNLILICLYDVSGDANSFLSK